MATQTRARRPSRRKSSDGSRAAGSGRVKLAASFLADVAAPIRDHLAASVELPDFLRTAGTLTFNERKLLVDQALVLFQQNYVHLPLKAAMYAVNPVQRLQLLRTRLERQKTATMDPEWMFHAEMAEIFHSVRDLHTNYLLPDPFRGKVAYLPFLVEEYFQAGEASLPDHPRCLGLLSAGFRLRSRGHALVGNPDCPSRRHSRGPVCRKQRGSPSCARRGVAHDSPTSVAPPAGRRVGDGELCRHRWDRA